MAKIPVITSESNLRKMRKRKHSEYDLELEDDNSDADTSLLRQERESDEDTEDASETDMVKQEEEYTEIKEQMYQDKLANLKKQLQQLEEKAHPEYVKRLQKLEQDYQDRLLLNEMFRNYEFGRIEQEFECELEAADKEYEEKESELKENLITELEEKKQLIETEHITMELTGDSMEAKPVTTRKLRRRPNDPMPLPEKRRKTSPTLTYMLTEAEILEDLKVINKGRYEAPSRRHESTDSLNSGEQVTATYEVKAVDGKLYYDKKWYHRGQPVYYEGKEGGARNSGIICTINSNEIWIKRMTDSNKMRIYISQLQKGRYSIRRRSS